MSPGLHFRLRSWTHPLGQPRGRLPSRLLQDSIILSPFLVAEREWQVRYRTSPLSHRQSEYDANFRLLTRADRAAVWRRERLPVEWPAEAPEPPYSTGGSCSPRRRYKLSSNSTLPKLASRRETNLSVCRSNGRGVKNSAHGYFVAGSSSSPPIPPSRASYSME